MSACGCHIEADNAARIMRERAEIRLCQLHDSAPALLAALEAITPEMPTDYTTQPAMCQFCGATVGHDVACVWLAARNAIQLAKGETE